MRGSCVHAVPRQVAELAHVQPGDRQPRQAGLPPLPVRRLVRRSDRAQQGALLRRRRAHAAGHEAGRQHAVACSRQTTASIRRRFARTCSRQGDGEPQPGAVSVGPLRPQHQLAAVRRGAAQRAVGVEHQREHVQLDQREPQLGARRLEAERVRLPVRRLQQRHPAQQQRPVADLPERRRDRRATRTRRRRPSRRSGSSATTSRGA